MPWTADDVDKHNKGLSDKQKDQWVAVANDALSRCVEDGGEEEACAASAIRQANAVVAKELEIPTVDMDEYIGIREIEGGVELTLEKFFSRKYYFLVTTSLYESNYIAGDRIKRDTRYNGNYVFNVLGGKEFTLGKGLYPWTLSMSGRMILAGGRRHTPIDLEASREKGYTVRKEVLAWSEQYDDFIRFDY